MKICFYNMAGHEEGDALDQNGERLYVGDEIRLRHNCCGLEHKPWSGVGNVVKLSDTSEEIMLELKGHAPTITTVGWSAEFVWKSTSFDRMQRAMKLFAVDDTSVSSYLYHRQAFSASHYSGIDYVPFALVFYSGGR